MVVRFYNGILAIVITTIVVFSALVLLNTYNAGRSAAQDMASDIFLNAIYNVQEKLDQTFSQARKVSLVLSQAPDTHGPIIDDGLSHKSLDTLIPLLLQESSIYSVYIGRENGDFLQVIATRGDRGILLQHNAPRDTAFIIRAIGREQSGERYERWSFLNLSRKKIGGIAPKLSRYDPRQRPWYRPAINNREPYLTEPYLFNSLKKTGVTLSQRMRFNRGVVGVDLLFSELSQFLSDQQLSKNGRLLLFDKNKNLVASSDNELSRLGESPSAILDLSSLRHSMIDSVLDLHSQEIYNRNQFVSVDDQMQLMNISEISIGTEQKLYIAAYGPFSDFSAHIIRLQQSVLMSVIFVVVLIVPGVYFLTRRLSKDLETLEMEAIDVRQLKFDKRPPVHSFIKEIDQLGSAFALMKKTIRRRTRDLEKTHQQLEFLVDQSISISAEKDERKMFELIASAAQELSQADRVILYLFEEASWRCQIVIVGDQLISIDMAEEYQHLPRDLTQPNHEICSLFQNQNGLGYKDAKEESEIFGLLASLDEVAMAKTSSLLMAPLTAMQGDLAGMLILAKHYGEKEEEQSFSSEEWSLIQSFSTQVANVEALRRREVQLEQIVQSRTVSLAEKEAQLRLALDNMPGGMFMIDRQQKVLVSNKKYEELCELPEGMLSRGRKLVDVLHFLSRRGDQGEAQSPSEVRHLADSFVSGEVISFERKLDTGRFLGITVSPTPDGGGVVVATDITESKVALQLLQEAEEKARSIIHNAADGIVVVDEKGIIQLFSPSAESIFGYVSKQVVGQSIDPLIPKVVMDQHQGFMRDFLYSADDFSSGERREAMGCRSTGELFPMDLAVGEAVVGDQKLYTGIVKDISERKEAERRLLDAYGIIQSSINYASRIQRSVLPDPELMSSFVPEHFVIWQPRDIVGGDIYWAEAWGDGFLIVLGDCTGHGVPGAFMTLIFLAVVDRVAEETEPGAVGELINKMHQFIQRMLGQQGSDNDITQDGIELGAFYYQPGKQQAVFSGARFDLYVYDQGELLLIKGGKKGIGYGNIPSTQTYEEEKLSLSGDAKVYMTTDGLIDQIGGPKSRAFGKRRFANLLRSIQENNMADQERMIVDTLLSYQGDQIRRDDVAVIGFTLPQG